MRTTRSRDVAYMAQLGRLPKEFGAGGFAMPEIGLFDAIYSARALRRLKPDPVPQEIITRILDAAVRAPSAGKCAALGVRGGARRGATAPAGHDLPQGFRYRERGLQGARTSAAHER